MCLVCRVPHVPHLLGCKGKSPVLCELWAPQRQGVKYLFYGRDLRPCGQNHFCRRQSSAWGKSAPFLQPGCPGTPTPHLPTPSSGCAQSCVDPPRGFPHTESFSPRNHSGSPVPAPCGDPRGVRSCRPVEVRGSWRGRLSPRGDGGARGLCEDSGGAFRMLPPRVSPPGRSTKPCVKACAPLPQRQRLLRPRRGYSCRPDSPDRPRMGWGSVMGRQKCPAQPDLELGLCGEAVGRAPGFARQPAGHRAGAPPLPGYLFSAEKGGDPAAGLSGEAAGGSRCLSRCRARAERCPSGMGSDGAAGTRSERSVSTRGEGK